MRFRSKIDNFTDATELAAGTERFVKTQFSMTLRGYLIPEEFNNIPMTQREITPKKLVITSEKVADINDVLN